MKPVMEIVNYIRTHALNHRQFKNLIAELDRELPGDLPLHCTVRWLSKGQVLSRFFELLNAVKLFMEEKDKDYPKLSDLKWIMDLAFLVNMLCHLERLNLNLQDLIRLTGSGSTRCSGRVEIYHNNIWGTVCDDGWDLNDAEVVCRELNCGTALEAPQTAHFGAGTGQIWLDNVACSGNESSLIECKYNQFGTHNCGHEQDAGVICSVYVLSFIGPVRLVGSGSTRCAGRVEVYHNNSWGTVCDDGWDLNDAEVVCRQLNCGTALQAPRSSYFEHTAVDMVKMLVLYVQVYNLGLPPLRQLAPPQLAHFDLEELLPND
ncbi:scavenger receptor cysteine-rich domain-containing group B protein-like [Oreochromis niloticus]|uniref:scavenger receptor cysteine-rich domain-containing group B protein-like n=1 Tax=Oreochromis niloticus TaxID=8128 RepID=UPI000DF224F8|nr:scavenger receptor cysteine-rich domain-containing group B protein-like [Oreochromis niloticus]